MRFVIILAAMVFAVTAASVSAQGRGGGQAKKTTVSAPKAKATQASGQTARQTQPARQTKKADTRVAKADARAAKATAKADARATKTTPKTTTRTEAPRTETPRTETPATKAETRAAKLNPNQEARLVAQLPAGMTVQDAAKGFKNWGQFQAAVNASTNHSISFVELKSKMTGIAPGATEPTMTPMSLGQALQSFGVTDTTRPTTPTTPTTR